ncbi:hypothetical protein [Sphingomonas astaxanthinifaciens]|uniref:GlsB/YeaQ/YmgE family stress response membrane protein n=1 Tax=Sphingomonas astaxanthinifaciens DSM 22298 TaxID=1123267 RepID=A0ABQ5Z990_9SPHN|nr:hypothetical protein [Sphingomonas astaxanthinifaciens]GLR47152.1 hypothetical protein GCM10007925_08630 [Sphingomonas astaxanthinifaciens DSM 22298]
MPLTWIALILAGAALGWLASVVLGAATPREILATVGLGAAGALLGALLITPVLAGRLEATGFSFPGVLLSLLGTFLALGGAVAVQKLQKR